MKQIDNMENFFKSGKLSPSTLRRLLKGQSHVNPEMALRLSKALSRAPEGWLIYEQ